MNPNVAQILSRQSLGWALYAVAAFVLFLSLTFPFEPLQARLLDEVARGTGWTLQAEQWEAAWPLGVVWHRVSATAPGRPRFEAEHLTLQAELTPLLKGEMRLLGQLRLGGPAGKGGGTISGRLTLESWSAEGPGRLSGSVESLDLAGLAGPAVRQGILQLAFDQRWKKLDRQTRTLQGQGTWQAEVTGLELDQVPVGPLVVPSLTVTDLKARLQCQDVTCRIEGLQGHGPDGTLTGEGVLTLRQPLADSTVILSLALAVSEDFKRRFPAAALLPGPPGTPLKITLTGPLANLQAKF